jgi:vacuolar-type H+-ATPase subunit F/Vma7
VTVVPGRVRRRLLVLTTPDLVAGYRLAGVEAQAVGSAAEAESMLRAPLEGLGIVAVHEPFLEALGPELRRQLEESTTPIVVGLPAGEAEPAEGGRRARLLRMLWQAVGYEIAFEPGERT